MTAYDAGRRVLDAVTAGLTAAGADVPERRYVQAGPALAWDQEHLVVAVTRPAVPGGVGREQPRARPCPGVTFCELRVELVRCQPTGSQDENGQEWMPEAAEIEAAAKLLLEDAEHLAAALIPASLVPRSGLPATVGAVVLSGPEGGLASVSALVQVPL